MQLRQNTTTPEAREQAIAHAALAVQRGELVVIPTDTVYGIAADAFDKEAVAELLEAKGRGREMPPPVLVSSPTTLDALAVRVPAYARALVEAFWPGPLTLVCHQQSSLKWDLGDSRGTVAIRMPDHPIALEILERTGPLAVSSANLTGRPAATDADQAEEMLGSEVATIVDDGPSPRGEASTIVDATGATPRVLREGALTQADLDEVLRPLGLALSGEPADPVVEVPVDLAKPAARKTAATRTTKSTAATKAPAKKAPAKKAPAKKAPAKKAPVKKAPVKKTTATSTTAKKAPASGNAPAKRAPAKKVPVEKAPVEKAPVTEVPPAEKAAGATATPTPAATASPETPAAE